MKSYVKSKMREPDVMPLNFGEQGVEILEELIDEAMATISPRDCSQCTQHASTFHPQALNMKDKHPGQ